MKERIFVPFLLFAIAVGFTCSEKSGKKLYLFENGVDETMDGTMFVPTCLTDPNDSIQKLYQMGRDVEQTKEHLPAEIRLSFSLTVVLGWGMTALCHSHFDFKGGCKVFVLRNEIKHHLTKVNVTDGQEKDVILDPDHGPEVSGTNATDFDLLPFAFFCADPQNPRKPLIDQIPSYSIRVNWKSETDPEYLEMHENGTLSLRSVLDLSSKEPHQFFRIQNTDGTSSLRSKAHNLLVESDALCDKFNFRGRGTTFQFFSACDHCNGPCGDHDLLSPFYVKKQVGADKERNPFIEFESEWFTGLHFFIAANGSNGVTLLSNKLNEGRDTVAHISGEVHEDSNRVQEFQPLLRVTKLYEDNQGRYQLNLGKSLPCIGELPKSSIKTAEITRRKAAEASPITRPNVEEESSPNTENNSCTFDYFNSMSAVQKVSKLFPQLFAKEPHDTNSFLVSNNDYNSVNAVPVTYFELESAMGVEVEYANDYDGGTRGKFVLIIAPGQSALAEA